MKSRWNIGKLRKGRLVRAVALLFLFHTGVDLLFPQLCSEEPVSGAIGQVLPVSKEATGDVTPSIVAVSVNDGFEEKQREEQPPRDEDCFCCCTHVMASGGFVNAESVDLKQPTNSRQNISILSVPPDNPYHPPRFA
ncbi:MAG: hypothetical protein ACRD8U_13505 [Pyrinomonadaceae bacterium]